ncbi:MAG: transposase [Candidatus Binatia bacterium]
MSTPRQAPDELWNELEPLFPAVPSHAKGGRHRASDRTLLDGMPHVLWTGCPWRALPRQVYGPWQTVYDRFCRLVVNWAHTLASRYAFLCLANALIAYRM